MLAERQLELCRIRRHHLLKTETEPASSVVICNHWTSCCANTSAISVERKTTTSQKHNLWLGTTFSAVRRFTTACGVTAVDVVSEISSTAIVLPCTTRKSLSATHQGTPQTTAIIHKLDRICKETESGSVFGASTSQRCLKIQSVLPCVTLPRTNTRVRGGP